jgi:hypothetical protein
MSENISDERHIQIQSDMQAAITSGNPKQFFNNFALNFPNPHGEYFYRTVVEKTNLMDTPNSVIWNNNTHVSEYFLSKTPRQFFADIDQVVEELGFTDKVKGFTSDKSKEEEFYRDVAPGIFMGLLKLGYSQAELTV